MDVLMVLIVVIGIAVSIASKSDRKKAQQKQMAAPEKGAAGPKAAPSQSAQSRTPSAAPSKFPTTSSSKFPPATSKRQPAAAQKTQSKPAAPAYGGTPRYTHVVTSTLEGGHTHTESSMTGEESCPQPNPVAAVKRSEEEKTAAENVGGLLGFRPNEVLQGILYAEILGKPKGLQRE